MRARGPVGRAPRYADARLVRQAHCMGAAGRNARRLLPFSPWEGKRLTPVSVPLSSFTLVTCPSPCPALTQKFPSSPFGGFRRERGVLSKTFELKSSFLDQKSLPDLKRHVNNSLKNKTKVPHFLYLCFAEHGTFCSRFS